MNGPARLLLLLWTAAASACASTPSTPTPDGGGGGAGAPVILEDDFAGAMAKGRAEGKPVFVDTWATWCHSCLAMKTQVLVDPRLGVVSDRFVWASLDSERPSSADFVARFPPPAMPTLYVIDPRTESLVLRWVGSATVDQLIELLQDARAAYDGQGSADATALLLQGDDAAAKKDDAAAMAAWREALARSPATWGKRARAADALLFALTRAGETQACADLARDELGKVDPSATGVADLAIGGLGCALELPAGPARDALVASLTASVEGVTRNARLLPDDRSGAYEALVEAADAAGDKARQKATAEAWAGFLEGCAERAKTPAERASFDAHRMLAYLAMGAGERALPMFAASERDFPGDYNPPFRTAYTLLQLGRYDEALAAMARAEALVYGPRALRIYAVKADIQEKRGDAAQAIAALDQALAAAAALPESQRPAKMVKGLSERRAKLAGP